MTTPPILSTAALTSDHVNYLVFRYLQEAGHETTATAFYRDWHRGHEFRDPENYPFAPVVRRNELIRIIQSGLHHDELEARVKKDERRFRFTRTSSRDAPGERQQQSLENGVGGSAAGASGPASRPGSSAKDKYRLSVLRAQQQDFPTPAPKRQRRSDGSEGVHLNGDVMDVDAASPSAADQEEDDDTVSPAVGSEPEMTEIPEQYEDVAVQTETKPGFKTSTMYWKIDKPNATLYHSVFNPTSRPGTAHTLLTAGESLCRFYQIPANTVDAQQVLSIDEPTLPPSAVVTASAWHPNGHVAAFAADTSRELPNGSDTSHSILFCHDSNDGSYLQYTVPPFLESQGITLGLHYSPQGDKLLVLRTDLTHSSILFYNAGDVNTENAYPIAWLCYENPVVAAAWLTEDSYIIVDQDGQSHYSQLEISEQISTDETAKDVKVHRSKTIQPWLSPEEAGLGFKHEKVCVHPSAAVAALASKQGRLVIGQWSLEQRMVQALAVGIPERLTAMAFQPYSSDDGAKDPVLLAATFEEGSCMLFSYVPSETPDVSEGGEKRFESLLELYLRDSPALALAWSPNGAYIAAAGVDLVQIWHVDALLRRDTGAIIRTDVSSKALVTWRPDGNAGKPRNGEHEERRVMSEPSLSWSSDGESLAFAVDKEVSIIRFRPSLSAKEGKSEVNGHITP